MEEGKGSSEGFNERRGKTTTNTENNNARHDGAANVDMARAEHAANAALQARPGRHGEVRGCGVYVHGCACTWLQASSSASAGAMMAALNQ